MLIYGIKSDVRAYLVKGLHNIVEAWVPTQHEIKLDVTALNKNPAPGVEAIRTEIQCHPDLYREFDASLVHMKPSQISKAKITFTEQQRDEMRKETQYRLTFREEMQWKDPCSRIIELFTVFIFKKHFRFKFVKNIGSTNNACWS